MSEKIKNNSVYVTLVNKKGEVSYKHIPLLDVEVEKGKTLGNLLEEKDKKIAELEKYNEKVDHLEKVIENTIRGFVTK